MGAEQAVCRHSVELPFDVLRICCEEHDAQARSETGWPSVCLCCHQQADVSNSGNSGTGIVGSSFYLGRRNRFQRHRFRVVPGHDSIDAPRLEMGIIRFNGFDVFVCGVYVVSLDDERTALMRVFGISQSLHFHKAGSLFRIVEKLRNSLGVEMVLRLLFQKDGRKRGRCNLNLGGTRLTELNSISIQ